MKLVLVCLFLVATSLLSASETEIPQNKGDAGVHVDMEMDVLALKTVFEENNVHMGAKLIYTNAKVDINFLLGHFAFGANLDINATSFVHTNSATTADFHNQMGTHYEASLQSGYVLYDNRGGLVGFLLNVGIYSPRGSFEGNEGTARVLIGSKILFVGKKQVSSISFKIHTDTKSDTALDVVNKSRFEINGRHKDVLDAIVFEAGIYNVGSIKIPLEAELKALFELYISESDRFGHVFLYGGLTLNTVASKKVRPGIEIGIRVRL